MLSWIHIGDLHVADGQSIRDLHEIVAQANACLAGSIDFALLPGDVANEGTVGQYRRARGVLDGLRLPLHIIPGDHDFVPGDLTAFHDALGAPMLPRREVIGGHSCLFLDVVSAGNGGPDFRLGAATLAWLEQQLRDAEAAELPVVVFMHVYPAELGRDAERVVDLFARHRVAFVAMGHTHYNELCNDGRTLYAAVRSTGQVEEGPVGFALTVLGDGVASWRFKELDQPWPFCLITAPADERLITRPTAGNQVSSGTLHVRCSAWSPAGIVRATCRVDDGPILPMTSRTAAGATWSWQLEAADGARRITVQVEDAEGRTDRDTIIARVSRDGSWRPPDRVARGSDTNRIGAWPEKGIPGGQLGPNRNGRQW